MKELRNEDCKMMLYSYDKDNSRVLSRVEIKSKNITTFNKIVEAVSKILQEECEDD